MRVDLKVPFSEKDEAKKLGARWDPARKIWYVKDKEDLSPFSRWSPTPQGSPSSLGAEQTIQPGKVIVGEKYRVTQQTCACLPWEDCEKCRT